MRVDRGEESVLVEHLLEVLRVRLRLGGLATLASDLGDLVHVGGGECARAEEAHDSQDRQDAASGGREAGLIFLAQMHANEFDRRRDDQHEDEDKIDGVVDVAEEDSSQRVQEREELEHEAHAHDEGHADDGH